VSSVSHQMWSRHLGGGWYLDSPLSMRAFSLLQRHRYHCSAPRKVKFTSADPSIAIGFLCRNESEIEKFYTMSQGQDRMSPLYSIGP
jgi:hypothetical protein